MLTFENKISYLESSLNKTQESYSDSFKVDIAMFINEFEIKNELLQFLNKFNSIDEIEVWISKLTSRIVLKYDSESEQINDFIFDYIKNG
jgi:uncharacterized protein YwgA